MGSWVELDAIYPEGKLTPATAFVVALGHMVGAESVYSDRETRTLAPFLTRSGVTSILSADVLRRAEDYLQERSLATFLEEANLLLITKQKLSILFNMIDLALEQGIAAPETHPRFTQFLRAFGISVEQIQPYVQGLALKRNLELFPQ
jgi:hypothetical protein